MAESEREQLVRQREAVTREMNRLRAADEPNEPDEPDDHDLVEPVEEEQRRARDVQDDDEPS
jgi:hypothetical protein